MTDRVLLTADLKNFDACHTLARENGLGLELMAFSYPEVLDNDWRVRLVNYQNTLRHFDGPLTLHGPFMDMVSGSPDERINRVCLERYRHALHIAGELGAELVVLHANFIGALHNHSYRRGWHERSVPFWLNIAEYAEQQGVRVAVENMWEFDPGIIADILRTVDHPALKACLDVGHAHLFGDDDYDLQDWIDTLAPWLIHTHMNNNNGVIDEHHGFDWAAGVLDYDVILKQLRRLDPPPTIVLEMWNVDEMRDSLHHFELAEAKPRFSGD